LAHGNNEENFDARAGALVSELELTAIATANTNMGEFRAFILAIASPLGGATGLHGNVRWRPNDMLSIGMGNAFTSIGGSINDINRLGLQRWGAGHVNREAEHRPAGVGDVSGGAIGFNHPFMHNRFVTGLFVDATPIDILRVGFAIPYAWTPGYGDANPRLQDELQRVIARVRVDLDGIGYVGFGYHGSHLEYHHGDFFGTFRMTMIDNIILDFGVRFATAHTDGTQALGTRGNATVAFDDSQLLSIGLGANIAFPAMNMGLNTRATAGFGIGDWWDDQLNATMIALDIYPWVELTSNIQAALNVGGTMNLAGSNLNSDVDAYIGWMVNPHFTFNIGAPRFNAGFRVFGHNNRGEDRNGARTFGWEVPVGFQFYF
jgi:hypothetical protein